jgi:hypothetical protein
MLHCVCVFGGGGCGATGAGVCLRACSITYPVCHAQAPYCHLRPLRLHKIFRHYLITDTIFGKKLLNLKCVFWFSVQLLFETFLIPRTIHRDIVMNVKTFFHVKYSLFFSDFNETWIFSTDVRTESSNIKFYQNPSSGSRVISCAQTDMKKLIVDFSRFHEGAGS